LCPLASPRALYIGAAAASPARWSRAGNVQPRPHINVMWIWIEGPRRSRVERQRAEMRRRGAVDDEDCCAVGVGRRCSHSRPGGGARRSSSRAVASGGLTGGARPVGSHGARLGGGSSDWTSSGRSAGFAPLKFLTWRFYPQPATEPQR